MKKIKCTFSYDGTNFSGSQIQPNKRTVQAEMEKSLIEKYIKAIQFGFILLEGPIVVFMQEDK